MSKSTRTLLRIVAGHQRNKARPHDLKLAQTTRLSQTDPLDPNKARPSRRGSPWPETSPSLPLPFAQFWLALPEDLLGQPWADLDAARHRDHSDP